MERAYTVKEIDYLRDACTNRWLYGTSQPSMRVLSRQYREAEKISCVEELVRTYMLAGIIAEDIWSEDSDKLAKDQTCITARIYLDGKEIAKTLIKEMAINVELASAIKRATR